MLKKDQLYLSTIDPNAASLAKTWGTGLEIAEFCTAWNMDAQYPQTEQTVLRELNGVQRRILHGPFNELFPCAIDTEARALAARRYAQALTLAERFGADKMVLHGGFVPRVYYPCWYVEQSALFWREFLDKHPVNCGIVLENVLEDDPSMLLEIVRQVNDPRLRLCLDVGHANVYSKVPAAQWVDCWGEYLTHTHIHNNDGSADTHSTLDAGTLPIDTILSTISDATVTLEVTSLGNAMEWLTEKELLEP